MRDVQRRVFLAGVLGLGTRGQEFAVATVKPTPADWRGGRYMRMVSPVRFQAVNFSPRVLIATAYGLNPRSVEGGPAWMDSERYDIAATVEGPGRPGWEQQMGMVQRLLASRFGLVFRRKEREMAAYAMTVLPSGPKMRERAAGEVEEPDLVNRIFPDHVELPGRNATMGQLAAVLQRSVFDRPVVDRTGLMGRYDFDLAWMADESQFDGRVPVPTEATRPSIFTAIGQQLGLRLEAVRAPVLVLAVDRIQRPGEN